MAGTIVIGAGQAASEAVFTLRANGYDKPVTLIGSEPVLPYQRPPLSKAYLAGEFDEERLFFKAPALYDDKNIDFLHEISVTKIDRAQNKISLSNNNELDYENLIISTGSRPRPLPLENADKANVFTIRSLADIKKLKPYFKSDAKLVIIGGGYIGLELAAVARKFGINVTLIEMMPRILARVARPETAAAFHKLHNSHGVEILLNTGVSGLNGSTRAESVTLDDGRELPLDFLVVGIGAIANDEIATEAGINTAGGIIVDSQCRTSDSKIFAAGDVARFTHKRYGDIRLESVGNAIAQGQIAAKTIAGLEAENNALPWFWSDQYDAKMQSAGMVMHDDVDAIVRPGTRDGMVSHWIYDKTGLLSVECINDGRSYLMGKRWLETGLSPDKNQIADPNSDLKTISTTPIETI